jgi:hypothetical protein
MLALATRQIEWPLVDAEILGFGTDPSADPGYGTG